MMAIPTTREELKTYILTKLGSPVITINIDDDQLEDAIDDALRFFREYHYEGSCRVFIAHQLTAADMTNEYITLGDDITAVAKVFKGDNGSSASSLFNIEYQLRLNDLWDTVKTDITQYYITRDYLALVDDVLNQPIRHRFKQSTHRLYIDATWGSKQLIEGKYIVAEAFQLIDPEEHTALYGNWVFNNLCAAYAKKRWGDNIIKFTDLQLPGGVSMNGERILGEAKEEIETIQTEFIMKYQDPDDFAIG